MGRKRAQNTVPCPHCGCTSVRKFGRKNGQQRWHCPACGKTFGATTGTPMYRLRNSPEEVARTLMVVMRRGSLNAAQEITRHKYETIGDWLRRAGKHAEALTPALAQGLEVEEVEVDAFWSFVRNASRALRTGQVQHRGWPNRLPEAPAGGA